MQAKLTIQTAEHLIQKMRVERERWTFMHYTLAVGATVGYDAPASVARKACPEEFGDWREAYKAAYGSDPVR